MKIECTVDELKEIFNISKKIDIPACAIKRDENFIYSKNTD